MRARWARARRTILHVGTVLAGFAIMAGAQGTAEERTPAPGVSESAASLAGAAGSVVVRNGGTNPASFSSTSVEVGGVWNLTVDLSTTGHLAALPFAFDSPFSLTLGGGQTLLCFDLGGSGELLGVEGAIGPSAEFSLGVPNVTAFCGFEFCAQALHYGGIAPFALSNALDVAIGSCEHPTQSSKLSSPTGGSLQYFGCSVAVGNGRALIGERGNDENGILAGAAHVYDAATGAFDYALEPSDATIRVQFGWSVAIDGDQGLIGAVGADIAGHQDAGAAYLFDLAAAEELRKLSPPDPGDHHHFGSAVSIRGSLALVGEPRRNEGAFEYVGAAYLFDLTTGNLLHEFYPSDGGESDFFGAAVALTATRAYVGAPGHGNPRRGAVYAFDLISGLEIDAYQASDGELGDQFGCSLSTDGMYLLAGAFGGGDVNQGGAAYVLDASTGAELRRLVPSDATAVDLFGDSVAVSGGVVTVGARRCDYGGTIDAGAAYVFAAATGEELFKIVPNDPALNDNFGSAVATDGDVALIGAEYDNAPGSDSGSAYLFQLP